MICHKWCRPCYNIWRFQWNLIHPLELTKRKYHILIYKKKRKSVGIKVNIMNLCWRLLNSDYYPYDEHEFDTLALEFVEKTQVGRAFKRFIKFDKTIYPPVLKVRQATYYHPRSPSHRHNYTFLKKKQNISRHLCNYIWHTDFYVAVVC